jgi:flavodoxin
MKSCIYYATRSGNTRDVAEAIATALRSRGSVEVHRLDGGRITVPDDVDLVVVGGPTEGRHATPAVTAFLEALDPTAFQGRAAAAFDTRLDWPRWLFGSAARDIADGLSRAGGRLAAEPESFFVTTEPTLVPGELARAERWADSLAILSPARTRAAAAS